MSTHFIKQNVDGYVRLIGAVVRQAINDYVEYRLNPTGKWDNKNTKYATTTYQYRNYVSARMFLFTKGKLEDFFDRFSLPDTSPYIRQKTRHLAKKIMEPNAERM